MAEFYRPPAGIALDELAERVAARVVDAYSAVEAELLAEIARRVLRDLPENADLADQLGVVRALQQKARDLIGTIPPDLAAQIVQLAVERGTAAAVARLGLDEGLIRTTGITRTTLEAQVLVAMDVGNAFAEVHRRILRYPIDAVGRFITTDAYQATVAQYLGLRLAGTLTTDEVRRRTLAAFLDQGITGFVDRSKRRWRIGSYTEMAVRTGTQRAFTDAGVARMLRSDTRFVTILGNNDACELCGAWFGKVLSVDGTPAGTHEVQHATRDHETVTVEVDATLDEARAAGFMHPNCACELAPWHPGLRKKQSASRYNPEAEAARDRQRALERGIREQKRRIAVHEATGLPATAEKASVRRLQARLRELTAESGQKRRYDREAVRWADGTPGAPTQPPVVPTVAPQPATSPRPKPDRARIGVDEP